MEKCPSQKNCWYLCKKAKVKLAKLQISYCNLAKYLLPTVKKAIIQKRLIVKL